MNLKKNISNETQRKIACVLYVVLLFSGMFMIYYGNDVFYTGRFNVDLSYNFGLMINDQNDFFNSIGQDIFIDYRNTTDKNSDGVTRTYTHGYWMGLNQMQNGLLIISYGVAISAIGASLLSYMAIAGGRKR